ncbi:protein broad-minded isoform X2 [Gouania willdenowi]|uniref:Protein broad-minded n=1 Tax=Gouania willdenowi TaxID=441366 RepID=A0A8C5DHG7_GOUWI|nr:protein broad-minded isoform X2 [Gouania willdenowi]
MSEVCVEDELDLQSLLKQLLRSISDQISSAPSTEHAEDVLLHLEETDKNFHNYELVKYLRGYVERSLGSVVDEGMKTWTRGEGQHAVGSGHDALIQALTHRTRDSAEYHQMMQTLKSNTTAVVESLIGVSEEELSSQSNVQYVDECSDSDSSFNQSYGFIRQEQLQVLAEQLDVRKPKEVRREALQALCSAPPSDVLSCESWSDLRRNLCAALTEPDLSDRVLLFFAKSLSSSPLNVTREIYTSLAKSVESAFVSNKLMFPSGSAVVDVSRPEISRLLKQIRLLNDFQREATTFWIRHPEKYMEEVMESTFSLLSPRHEPGSCPTERTLEPVHLLVLLDVRATWFIRWMHGCYSRTVVLRLLQRKYKCLIVSAIQQCIHYRDACELLTRSDPQMDEHQHDKSEQRGVYSGRELEYAHFVHSLSLLGKVIVYKHGRKLFPVRVKKHKDPVSLTDLIVILITIMYRCPKPQHSSDSHTVSWWPSYLVMQLLWTLSERDQCAAECLYQRKVMETLLYPVIALLNGQQVELNSPVETLTLIADVLARIANTDRGLSLFLSEQSHSERGSAAHVVARFTLRLLDEDVPLLIDSQTLCGPFIFVCRQIYNSCEGLQVLRGYGLHQAIAAAWRRTSSMSERVPTPVPGTSEEASSMMMQSTLLMEETLLDSLLNFAVTPRGVLLLQQSGAITECVQHMFSRFTKKLQVSRCEKFGYGVMVTQVAATAPGVVALQRSGYVRALAVELWSVLECGSDDVRMVRPKPTPMEPIDRSCLKSFLSLVNLLSSSQSVWELLSQQPLANRSEYTLREVPTSVPDLIDRLISVDSQHKIHSLFHYEQSHTFGLRLLSVLCCHLDSFLLLESQYDLCSVLLQSQRDNRTHQDANDGGIMVDALSVERNHVLVRVGALGGPSERRLPSRSLQEGERPYPWPMFSSFPLPSCYTVDPPEIHQTLQDSDISTFVATLKIQQEEEKWLESCRDQYRKVITSRPNALSGTVLADLLEKVVAHLSSSDADCFFSAAQYKAEEKQLQSVVLSSVEQLGIHTCLRYGHQLRLLRDDAGACSELTLLMKHVKLFLSTQRVTPSSKLLTQHHGYPGHDWLASTVFLLMAGNAERSLRLLLDLSSLLTSAFIWPARIHSSVHVPAGMSECGISPLYWCTAHYVELLLKQEVPLVHSAFKMSGFTPSQMCIHWLTQCFWNYLDWAEVVHYVLTCVLMGPDYQVYVCVAVLKHLQSDILQHTHSQQLQVFLKEEPIRGFKVGEYLDFLKGLESSYRSIVLSDMKSIRNPVE